MVDLSQNLRYQFAQHLYQLMKEDERVWLLVGDLGYKIFDQHRDDFPERVVNCGAAEQAMMGMAVGLAQTDRIPFVYSITPFLLYRPFETIRTYINHEQPNVKLIGSGRDQDYHIDGISHYAGDDKDILSSLTNIRKYWPDSVDELPTVMSKCMKQGPVYVNLKR